MTTTFSANVTVTGGAANSVTDGAITYPFVGTPKYNTGVTLDGLPYVIAPAGIKLTEPTPVSATVSSRYTNGQMINVQRVSGPPSQALESDLSGSMTGYNPAVAATFTGVLAANSSIVKVKSKSSIVDGRRGLLDQWSGLYVVSAAKPANAMAPFIWPSADLANRPWRAVNVDNLLSLMNSFTALGTEVPWATLSPYYARLDLGPAITADILGGYQYLSPYLMGDQQTSSANYDQYKVSLQDHVLIGLMSNAWSTADKTAAMISVLQKGCQVGETLVAFNAALGEDGAHYGSQYAPCMAWLRGTGRESQYSTWLPIVGGNFYGQYYAVTAGMFANHTSASLPYIARERTVTSITGSGPYVVKATGYNPSSGLTGDTSSNGTWTGLNLVRKTNSATALITSSAQDTSSANQPISLTVSALPTGLIVGDVIYCAEVSAMSVGTADFSLRGIGSFPNLPNPSPSAQYRDQQITAISHLFVHNIQMHGAAMNTARSYVQRAMTGGSGLPSCVSPLDASVTGSSNTTSSAFYSAYASTLWSKTQVV